MEKSSLTSNNSMESENLWSALKKGDEKTFSSIFRLHYPALLNYAGRLVRDEEDAKDIVQEVFCRLYENRANLNVNTSLKSYLYKSVYNRCLDLIKHRKTVKGFETEKSLHIYLDEIIQLPEAELQLINQETGDAIRQAIKELPERCREIFCLSKLDGLTNKEIAERLGISVKTVENQMTTALKRLQKELEWLLILFFFMHL